MWKKKSLISVGVFVLVVILITLNCFTTISPGYVGVVVDMLGDEKGVEPKELHVGIHFLAPWKKVYEFPIFEQNHTWQGEVNGFNFQTSEGMAVHADLGITYHLRSECIPLVFEKYRRGMDEITHIFLRNFIRDAVNKSASRTHIEDLYSGKGIFFEEIEKQVREQLNPIGIEITRIYLIGRFHFPTNVIAALNAKIEAMQRAQQRENELREAEAQAKKEIAKAEGEARCKMLYAEAEANSNLIVSKSLTSELIRWQTVQKWDGVLPQVTSSAMPLIELK